MRKTHLLSNIKTSQTWSYFTFLDTETHPEDKMDDEQTMIDLKNKISVDENHEFYLAVACHYEARTKREKWVDYTGPNADRNLWVHIDQITKPGTKRIILAHNTKYDLNAAGGLYWLNELGYTLDFFAEDNPFIMSFIKETQHGKKTLVMLSSTNWYGVISLKKLGDLFNLPKLDTDVFNAPQEEILTYCHRDVEILKAACLGYLDFVVEKDLGVSSYTIAKQAMVAFRHRFMHHNIYIHDKEEPLILERASYYGGRTEVFRLGAIDGKVYGYDVNSMYPSVMRSNNYPTGIEGMKSDLSIKQVKQLINNHCLLAGEVWLDTDEPVYPYKEGGKLTFPTGRFKAVLSTPEIEYAINNDHIVKFGRICSYRSAPIFTDYVDFFYGERLKAKANGDKIRDKMYKLFLNSLYGKFGQLQRYNEKFNRNVDVKPTFGVMKVVNSKTEERHTVKVIGKAMFYKEKLTGAEAESFDSFPTIAAHVTAYARMQLWSLIKAAGRENTYYCDTDSLFVNERGKERLESSGFVHSTELGKVKLEKQTDKLIIHGLKDYEFGDEIKIKGIPKKAVKIDENKYLCRQWPGTSTFLRSGDVRGYHTHLMIKNLKREYNKGNVLANGVIEPFVLMEKEPEEKPEEQEKKRRIKEGWPKLITSDYNKPSIRRKKGEK